MKMLKKLAVLVVLLGVISPAVFAQDGVGEEPPTLDEQVVVQEQDGPSIALSIAIFGACLGAGLCAIGGGFAIARIGAKCIEAIARQPEAAGAMFAPMIVSAAMVEGGMLFAIVVCLLGVLGI